MEDVRPFTYADTDSIKCLPIGSQCLAEFKKNTDNKALLNSIYGVQNMNKLHNRPYIVIHQYISDDDIRPAIIFIDMIASIEMCSDGKAEIATTSSKWLHTVEPYTEIVRKLFND